MRAESYDSDAEQVAPGNAGITFSFHSRVQGPASQSFSFDQFFAGAEDRPARPSPSRGVATPVDSPASPAERGADDIEQFNSWLQGLKQR